MSKRPITAFTLRTFVTLSALAIIFSYGFSKGKTGESFNEEMTNLLNNQDNQSNPLLEYMIENFDVEEPLMIGSLGPNRRLSLIVQDFLLENNLDYFDLSINFSDNSIVELKVGGSFQTLDNFITTCQPPYPRGVTGGMDIDNVSSIEPSLQVTLNDGLPNETFLRMEVDYNGAMNIIFVTPECRFQGRLIGDLEMWDLFLELRDNPHLDSCDALTDLSLN